MHAPESGFSIKNPKKITFIGVEMLQPDSKETTLERAVF